MTACSANDALLGRPPWSPHCAASSACNFGSPTVLLDHFPQRAADPPLDLFFLPPLQPARNQLRHRVRRQHRLERLARGPHAVEVAVDASGVGRKARLERLDQSRGGMFEFHGHAGEVHAVVDGAHRGHRNAVRRERVEHLLGRAHLALCLAGATDVVHSDVEPVAIALERLGQPTQLRMALQDQDSLAFMRKRRCRGEAPDAGADDDDVPLRHDAPPSDVSDPSEQGLALTPVSACRPARAGRMTPANVSRRSRRQSRPAMRLPGGHRRLARRAPAAAVEDPAVVAASTTRGSG